MVVVESSKEIYNNLLSAINKASSKVLVVTEKLDQDVAEALLSRAASGIDIKLITSDNVWSKWLANSKLSYRIGDEKKIQEELNELEHQITLFSRLPIIVAVILYAISFVLFLKYGSIFLLFSLIISTLITIIIFYYIKSKRLKEMYNQYNISKENLNNFQEQSKAFRNEISKRLEINESKDIGFTIICCDSDCFITSMPLIRQREEQYHFFDRVNYGDVVILLSQIPIAH
jgi:ABC-type multidrug transport system fused ATPase/permease subunit